MFPDRGTGRGQAGTCDAKEGLSVSGDGRVLRGLYHKRKRGHSKIPDDWKAASAGATGIWPRRGRSGSPRLRVP